MSNCSFLEKRRLCEINCLSRVVYDTLVYNNETVKIERDVSKCTVSGQTVFRIDQNVNTQNFEIQCLKQVEQPKYFCQIWIK